MVYSKTLTAKQLLVNLPESSGYLIAYSGGADSTALLHLMSSIAKVRAIHINHGLNAESNLWQQHCQENCEKLGIPLIIERANLFDASENTCRAARYVFFKKHLKPKETLLTAHHAQDQAETVLLKLLRGTGINGITGIKNFRDFAKGYIARPLLETHPQDLKEYLQVNHINWIEDSSNQDNNYRRNHLRNNIIPELQKKFPNIIDNINRSANNAASSLRLLNYLSDFKSKSLAINKLGQLPKDLQTTLFYHWLCNKNIPIPDQVTLKQILHDFITAKKDKNPHYKNQHYQLYRWQDEIYCVENFDIIDPNKQFTWDCSKFFELPNGCGMLDYTGNKPKNLTIRFNRIGEKLQTYKHQFSKKIKQLYHDHNIPTWEKSNTPFIYDGDELISLGYDWSHKDNVKNDFELKLKIRML